MGGKSPVTVEPRFITALESRLALPVPGAVAQAQMAPEPRTVPPLMTTEDEATPSAVLILLFSNGGEWSFFLTERSNTVEYHPGQLSLPGGAQEKDESLKATALRETEEEIGIASEAVTVLGELTTLFIPVSGFRVYPFVGWINEELETTIDQTEVSALHAITVPTLLDESLVRRETRTIRGVQVDVPYFHFGELKVWGATAAILSECRTLFADCFDMENTL